MSTEQNAASDHAVSVLAESEGISVLGVGPCAPMESGKRGYRPQDFLPGARSMVCFGIPVPRGVYGDGPHATEMVWRAQNLYYRRLDTLSLRLAQHLEEQGERAAPVFGCCPMAISRRREVAGYLDLIRMGQHVGIGAVGKNGLLVHPRYGSRLMLGGLVTTAELAPFCMDGCKGSGCPADCRICVDACPVRAISPERRRVDIMRCLRHTARTPLMSRSRFALLLATNRDAAARLMNQTSFDDHTLHVCSLCVQRCPLGGAA